MSALRDKIQRKIESTGNDVAQWHQQPIVVVAGAVEALFLDEIKAVNEGAIIDPDKETIEKLVAAEQALEEATTLNEALEKDLTDATDRVKELEKELAEANNPIKGDAEEGDEDEEDDEDPEDGEDENETPKKKPAKKKK